MFNLMPYSRRSGNVARKDDWFGVEKLFDDFFRDPFFEKVSAMATPIRADIKETDKEYVVEAEIPGVKKEDIVIDLNDNVLTLGVDVKNETDNEDNGYIYKERQSGSYRRSFRLDNVKNEDVSASYKDGLLVINLPKADPGSKTRKIEIQ